LRRRKQEVGDVEILFVPKIEMVKPADDFFAAPQPVSMVASLLDRLVASGSLAKRLTVMGSETWGPKNKLAVHIPSGIPVDFFAATETNWFNYLVCRTGSAESNMRIASAAQARRWKWNPYGDGFTDERGALVRVSSEKDVFTYVGLPFLQPWQRI
jgi:DNA polymerase/3'-5' exonuclease PolX